MFKVSDLAPGSSKVNPNPNPSSTRLNSKPSQRDPNPALQNCKTRRPDPKTFKAPASPHLAPCPSGQFKYTRGTRMPEKVAENATNKHAENGPNKPAENAPNKPAENAANNPAKKQLNFSDKVMSDAEIEEILCRTSTRKKK